MGIENSVDKISVLASFKNGNEETYELIFQENYEALVGFCNQFIPDIEEAKNISQQAFIKLWLNRQVVRQLNGIRAFLYTAAKTECLNYLRHEKYKYLYRMNKLEVRETQLNEYILNSFSFDTLELSELEEIISESIDKLPERCRQVFLKSRFEGKKNKEIANELGIATKSVESNITRALKTLRIELKDYLSLVIWML